MDKEKSVDPFGEAGAVWSLGMMSGTSLDGVDAAMIRTDGVRIFEFGPSAYRAYGDNEAAVLRSGLGLWPGAHGVEAVAEAVTSGHRSILAEFDQFEVVGFHGQTLAHDPRGRGTHQCGDAWALARAAKRPVVWDFRSADVAAGGEGAPLAPVYHWALARWLGDDAPLCFLNLGGVGNVTWVDPKAADPFVPGAMLAFDTGPANAPINDLVKARRGWSFDRDGGLAAAGIADTMIAEAALEGDFFSANPPKSLDRDAFAGLVSAVADLSDEDAAATLVAVVAGSVARAFDWFPSAPKRLLICGGGRKNAAILQQLSDALPCPVVPVDAVGLDGDMLEAQAFAYLAVRSLRGLALSGPNTTAVPHPCQGGRVAWP